MYPKMLLLALPLANPKSRKEKLYNSHYSSARKAIERVFRVLFRQFEIFSYPCRLESFANMNIILNDRCIIHKMVTKETSYAGTLKFCQDLEEEENMQINMLEAERVEFPCNQAKLWRKGYGYIKDYDEHKLISKALIRNIWDRAGEQ